MQSPYLFVSNPKALSPINSYPQNNYTPAGKELRSRPSVQLEVGLKALKARNSKAQGVSPGGRMEQGIKPCKGETGSCAALTGLMKNPFLTQGFGCFAAFILGYAVARFQRAPRCMP